MGETIEIEDPAEERKISVRTIGTEEIDKIEILRNNVVSYACHGNGLSTELTWIDDTPTNKVPSPNPQIPGLLYYYARITQQDGNLAWSSPIWVERKHA